MKILKDLLGGRAEIYHIYTDGNPRYVGGSAGLAFFHGKIVIAIRQTSNIPIGGQTHYNYKFIEDHSTPYLNNSICKMGFINPESFGDNNIMYVKTKNLNTPPSGKFSIYRGLEDPRLAIWGDELYVYGTQYTDNNPNGTAITCCKLDDNLQVAEIQYLPGRYEEGLCDQPFTEKNWMAIPGEKIDFVYKIALDDNNLCFPEIYSIKEKDTFCISAYRGSTPLIKAGKEYLSIIHTTDHTEDSLMYSHILTIYDENLNLTRTTENFHFEQEGIEFTTGWCEDDKGNLYIAYSTTDGTTNILKTTIWDLIDVLTGSNYGNIMINHKEIADKIFISNPIDASQYYWKDWIQNGNRDSLYSHYAILLHYLDRYLLPDTLPYLEDDTSTDAMILKIYNHRRTSRDFHIFYEMLRSLPGWWRSDVHNKHIKMYCFEKQII